MSTNRLTKTKIVAITIVHPITKGKSPPSRALNMSKPIPFHPNTNSTNTAPASIEANHPDVAVKTGLSEFLKTCLNSILVDESPLARAVLI